MSNPDPFAHLSYQLPQQRLVVPSSLEKCHNGKLAFDDDYVDDSLGEEKPVVVSNQKKTRTRRKSSAYRGVSRCAKDGRWQARIRIGREVKYLGRFKTEKDAARRYDVAAVQYHGTRAVLNFLHTQSPEMPSFDDDEDSLRKRANLVTVDSSASKRENSKDRGKTGKKRRAIVSLETSKPKAMNFHEQSRAYQQLLQQANQLGVLSVREYMQAKRENREHALWEDVKSGASNPILLSLVSGIVSGMAGMEKDTNFTEALSAATAMNRSSAPGDAAEGVIGNVGSSSKQIL